MKHYELAGDHFADTKGYESYTEMSAAFAEAGVEEVAKAYLETNSYGSPEQIIEKLTEKREILGDFDLNVAISYGGRRHEDVERMMRLFSEQVIPALAALGDREDHLRAVTNRGR